MSAEGRPRREDGTYGEEYDRNDVLRAVREIGFPKTGTKKVSEQADVPRRTTLNILHDYEEEGVVESEEVNGGFVWQLTERGERALEGSQ
jgi:CTP-dependent riboflavin kinase